jgi:sensor c-di-GMP phosphodiesterase-like protein
MYKENKNLIVSVYNKSFIYFINCDVKKDLIVKNMIDFAHILDMGVVAEGVDE